MRRRASARPSLAPGEPLLETASTRDSIEQAMALCSVVASFLVNAAFAFATKPREALSPAQLAVASKNNHDRHP